MEIVIQQCGPARVDAAHSQTRLQVDVLRISASDPHPLKSWTDAAGGSPARRET